MDEASRRHMDAVAQDAAAQRLAQRRSIRSVDALERVKLGLEMARPFIGKNPAVEAAADKRMLAQANIHRRWEELQRKRGRGGG